MPRRSPGRPRHRRPRPTQHGPRRAPAHHAAPGPGTPSTPAPRPSPSTGPRPARPAGRSRAATRRQRPRVRAPAARRTRRHARGARPRRARSGRRRARRRRRRPSTPTTTARGHRTSPARLLDAGTRSPGRPTAARCRARPTAARPRQRDEGRTQAHGARPRPRGHHGGPTARCASGPATARPRGHGTADRTRATATGGHPDGRRPRQLLRRSRASCGVDRSSSRRRVVDGEDQVAGDLAGLAQVALGRPRRRGPASSGPVISTRDSSARIETLALRLRAPDAGQRRRDGVQHRRVGGRGAAPSSMLVGQAARWTEPSCHHDQTSSVT